MALSLKFKYLRMLNKRKALTRANSTKIALGMTRVNMLEYDLMLNKLARTGLVKIKKCTKERRGQIPDIISITEKGEEWVRKNE